MVYGIRMLLKTTASRIGRNNYGKSLILSHNTITRVRNGRAKIGIGSKGSAVVGGQIGICLVRLKGDRGRW